MVYCAVLERVKVCIIWMPAWLAALTTPMIMSSVENKLPSHVPFKVTEMMPV